MLLLVLLELGISHLGFSAERPNVLIFITEDQSADLGCYGSTIGTPALDRLASQGTRLSNFRVNPMCVVTRTSLMTGHTHSQSHNYRRSLPIARALADAGYQTSISGKWHQPSHPLDHGFAHFYGFLEGQINCLTGSDAIMHQRRKVQLPPDWYAPPPPQRRSLLVPLPDHGPVRFSSAFSSL